MNIKSEEAYHLAAELAELTGARLTAAVLEALRQRLDKERRARERETKVAAILALGKEIRRLCPDASSSDTDDLYGEDGLPL